MSIRFSKLPETGLVVIYGGGVCKTCGGATPCGHSPDCPGGMATPDASAVARLVAQEANALRSGSCYVIDPVEGWLETLGIGENDSVAIEAALRPWQIAAIHALVILTVPENVSKLGPFSHGLDCFHVKELLEGEPKGREVEIPLQVRSPGASIEETTRVLVPECNCNVSCECYEDPTEPCSCEPCPEHGRPHHARFYAVMRDPQSCSSREPSVAHDSMEAAEAEAYRLCAEEHDDFYVLEAIGVYCPGRPVRRTVEDPIR